MARREDGFTLAELLISTVILAIIFGVITEAMIVGLRTTDSTDQRIRESVDAQLASVYFSRDVQAATSVAVGNATCGGAASVVTFSWTDPAAAGVTKRASYVLNAQGLTRWFCQTGQPDSQKTIGPNVGSVASLVCDSGACTG